MEPPVSRCGRRSRSLCRSGSGSGSSWRSTATLVLMAAAAALLAGARVTAAQPQTAPDCDAARARLLTNPDIAAFRYYPCLSEPRYQQEANAFLAPVTSVAEVLAACIM
ncbi:hypothetical protein HYH03_008444 [Edaphochlamys debaryana]|uniref:Uncharacterized protein n=1 Tax=Edaphochlamys debaryana TaxID=47281 RepID=A0A835Y956_9CHLO|nr:hypothetical protein HYH03_008444 [Edaphochlamys debaryana]|eukprot:KAG2493309.1 hypothetical protein HYH03_008444 [Edaphochlamys debaryana]